MGETGNTRERPSDEDFRNVPEEEPTYEMPPRRPPDGGPVRPTSFDSVASLGSDVYHTVSDAVEAADFKGLAASVSKAVRAATEAAAWAMRPSKQETRILKPPPGRRAGALARRILFGYLVFLLSSLLLGGILLLRGDPFMGGIMSALSGAGLRAVLKQGRVARADHRLYRSLETFSLITAGRDLVTLNELAVRSGLSVDQARMCVGRAIDLGYIPEGHLGRTERDRDVLYLSDRAYQSSYALSPSADGAAREAPRAQGARQQAAPSGEARGQEDPRVEKIVAEGRAYIERIHRANDVIGEDEMSDKLGRLETVVRRIVGHVQGDPDSSERLGRFMDYYLPTTGKLVDSYADLERSGASGRNADATRREIKETIDVINDAFERLADDLLQDATWDLSSDMHVMRTMLKQDGLTDDGGPKADS